MSKDANSFGHDKALAWESRGFVYTKKRMHRFDTPSYLLYSMWLYDDFNITDFIYCIANGLSCL